MDQFIAQIVVDLQEFFRNDYIVAFVISMIPMIEVRGAIPIALQMGMTPVVAYFFTCISALVICPILMVFLKPILEKLKKTRLFKKIANAFEEIFTGKAKKIETRAELKSEERKRRINFYKMLGIFFFVAIPLPMTGLWTGTAVAIFLNMDLRMSFIPLIIGNFVAGAIILTASLLLGDNSYLIILILFGFIIITLIGLIITMYIKRKKNNQKAVIYSNKDSEL